MKPETAVLSAVFPTVLPYIDNLITSLSQQTETAFDWIVLNDGIDHTLLQDKVRGRFDCVILPVVGMRPAENRWYGIEYCIKKGYKYLIFQDADDWMSTNRIADAAQLLQKAPIVFHALSLTDEKGTITKENIWSDRLTSGCQIGCSFIQDKNCIGLGNAAIQTSVIKKKLEIPETVIAIDWFIFYHLLQEAVVAIYSDAAKVYYRQYAFNTAGIGLLTKERITKAIFIKQQHYLNLIQDFPDFLMEQEKLNSFEHEVLGNPNLLDAYISRNKEKGLTSFWWEETNYQL